MMQKVLICNREAKRLYRLVKGERIVLVPTDDLEDFYKQMSMNEARKQLEASAMWVPKATPNSELDWLNIPDVTMCHDFINKGCNFEECHYIHTERWCHLAYHRAPAKRDRRSDSQENRFLRQQQPCRHQTTGCEGMGKDQRGWQQSEQELMDAIEEEKLIAMEESVMFSLSEIES